MSTDQSRNSDPVNERARVPLSDLIVGGLSVAGGIGVILYALTMPTIGEGEPGPGLFPGMIGGFAILFGSLMILFAVLKPRLGRGGAAADQAAAPPAAADRPAVEGPDPEGSAKSPAAEDAGTAGAIGEPVEGDTLMDADMATTQAGRWVNGLVVLGSIGFYVLAAETLGFFITMFVILVVLMLTLRSKWLPAVLISGGLTGLLYAMFDMLLLVQLPDGIFF